MKRNFIMYQILRQKNEGMRKSVIDFTKKLIQTPSVSLDEKEVAQVIEQQMKQAGYEKVIQDEAGNVIGMMQGRQDEPTLLLASHMDTVESSDSDNNIQGKIKDDRIYGLGAADCKAGLAAQVFAGSLLKRSFLPLRGNLIVAATVAEQNGLSIGVKWLLEKTLPELGIKPTFAILGECTGLGLYYGHDGWVELEITVEGTNPFHVDDSTSALFDHFKNDAPEADKMLLHRPRFQNENGIPQGRIRIDKRLAAAEDAGDVLDSFKQTASLVTQAMGSVAVEVAVRQEQQQLYTGRTVAVRQITHAWETNPFSPLMERARQSLAAAGCKTNPGKFQLGQLGMGTAGSVLTKEFNVPTIAYGPGNEAQAHKENEYVEISKLGEAVYGTAAMAHSLIGIPVFGWTSDEI